MNNPSFNPVEFDGIRMQAGLNTFALTPKQWIERTAAIGIVSRPGRYGGTFAHSDIAFEFATWVSVEFKLYLIKEFQRLKAEESQRLADGWDLKRSLAKINYRIHTDAIKSHLIPAMIDAQEAAITYANEADLLNLALFGMTARQWRDQNPQQDGNIRDNATVEQLVVLSNLERRIDGAPNILAGRLLDPKSNEDGRVRSAPFPCGSFASPDPAQEPP